MDVREQMNRAEHDLPDEITGKIPFLVAVREAEEDIREGRTITNEEMATRIAGWLQVRAK